MGFSEGPEVNRWRTVVAPGSPESPEREELAVVRAQEAVSLAGSSLDWPISASPEGLYEREV